SVGHVLSNLADKPSYSTVRAQLRVLEEKGPARHEGQGLRYVYVPAVPRDVARRSALRHLVETFFDGSTEKIVAALLGGEVARISPEEFDRLARLIAKGRRRADHEHARQLRTRAHVFNRVLRQGHHSSRVCLDN